MNHIYWFSFYNANSPSVRYRGIYFLGELKTRYGISNKFIIPGYRLAVVLNFITTFLEVLFWRKKDSVVIIQKIYSNWIYGNLIKLVVLFHGKSCIYDIDDSEYLRHSPKTVNFFLRKCALIFVGSEAIKEYALKLNPNVEVLTSPIIIHKNIKVDKSDILSIGWVGFYNTHRLSLKHLFFESLTELGFNIKLTIMGVIKQEHFDELETAFNNLSHIDLYIPRNINWQDENEVYRMISQFDIGVSPLTNTRMNKAKSAFKMKQYFSCDVPVLASPTGENSRFINHGYNGFICETTREFREKIEFFEDLSDKEYGVFSEASYTSTKNFNYEMYCGQFMSGMQNHGFIKGPVSPAYKLSNLEG